MSRGKVAHSISVGDTDHNHLRANIIAIYTAQLLNHTHNGGEMGVAIEQVHHRVALLGKIATSIAAGDMHPHAAVFFEDVGVQAVDGTDCNRMLHSGFGSRLGTGAQAEAQAKQHK